MNRSNPLSTRPLDAMHPGLALSIALFLAMATLPYSWLIEHFGYDGILREPAAVILSRFHAGGAPLVLAWFAFAMSSLAFIPVALAFGRIDHEHRAGACYRNAAVTIGLMSAAAQAVGLLRWVLVVPPLAASFVDPATDAAGRQMLVIVFDAVHRYGGMVLGEMVGQLLLAAWTALTALQLWRSRAVPRWLAAAGWLTVPFWFIGQTELLHQVVPSIPALRVVPLAFMGWETWLAALAVWWGGAALRQRAPGRTLPAAGRTQMTGAAQ